MTVSELIKKLSKISNKNFEVSLLFEGITQSTDYVFETKGSRILICDHFELYSAKGKDKPVKEIKSIFDFE